MCKFCTEHGEGKKWYLQSKNYAEELFNEERKAFMKDLMVDYEKSVQGLLEPIGRGLVEDPVNTRAKAIPEAEALLEQIHHGQVILYEEAQQMFDIATHIARMPCTCRSMLHGKDIRLCYGIASWKSDVLPGGFLMPYPDYADMEILSPEVAKREVRKYAHEGMVHTTWTMLTPFVYHICNCTMKECTVLKARKEMGVRTLFKGEYVARIDPEECTGCRECMKMCNFGAIKYSVSMDKCYVNTQECWGCGICRVECRHEGINMIDRNTIPALANSW